MTTSREIVTTYERLEVEAGGIAKADPKAIAEATAAELGVPYEDVREALMAAWTAGGGG